MADDDVEIVPREEALEATSKPVAIDPADKRAAVSKKLAEQAVEKALGDQAGGELKKALAAELAPWAERMVTILDDALRIPGTNVKIGLDPILGLIPGIGDVVTGGSSAALLLLALKERVPTIAILRMIVNIFIDTLVGMLPVVGDVFDFFYRSNRQNLEIIRKYKTDPKAEPTTTDKALVGVGFALIAIGVVTPLLFGAALGAWITAILHAG
jgi:hypothetical protein